MKSKLFFGLFLVIGLNSQVVYDVHDGANNLVGLYITNGDHFLFLNKDIAAHHVSHDVSKTVKQGQHELVRFYEPNNSTGCRYVLDAKIKYPIPGDGADEVWLCI